MKYHINYNNMPANQLKRDKALADIKQYCTPLQYSILWKVAMEATKYQQLSFCCSFAGISGYPIVALWDEARQIMKDMTS